MISNGTVIAPVNKELPISAVSRLLAKCPLSDRAVLIEVPSGPRKKVGKKHTNYYVRSFYTVPLTKLAEWLDTKQVIETSVTLPGWWYDTDENIRKAFPPRGKAEESSMLAARERKWDMIKTLVELVATQNVDTFLSLDQMADARAKKVGVSPVQMKGTLHRYFAFGSIPNALLPNNPRKGAPGKPRIAKDKKLGRKNAAAKAGNNELEGKLLTWEDRQNLADGWTLYMRPGTNREEAYIATMGVFYNEGYIQKHGVWTPNLLPAHQRPTFRNFEYHGPMGNDSLLAARRLIGEGQWARDYRPLMGTATDGIVGIGHVGSLDASPIDVNLNAIFSRICPVGVGRGVFVRDAKFGIYCGWHVGIGGIGTDDVNLALLCAATDKTKLLKRYDLADLDPEGIPTLLFLKLYSDNGELRSIKGIDANVKEIGSTIEFIESGRGDRNSVSEAGHHQRHRKFDHYLEGSNYGRTTRRGETPPIKNALLNAYEYIRLLIRWIYWVNTQQKVPQHFLTTEMRRDNVQPNRMAIFRWANEHGLVREPRIDLMFLKAKLLPAFTASIHRNGIVLHRPHTGNVVELLPHARFNGDYLATSGLIRRAQNGGDKYVTVKAHPEDLSTAYLIDRNGVHELKNTSHDTILLHEGSIPDLCAMTDSDRLRDIDGATQYDQDLSDQRAYREEEQEIARQERKAERELQKGRHPNNTERSKVRENQVNEKQKSLEAAAMRAAGEATASEGASSETAPTTATSQNKRLDDDERNQDGALQNIPNNVVDFDRQEIYRKRLSQFHKNRG